jgi:hypothetical protein
MKVGFVGDRTTWAKEEGPMHKTKSGRLILLAVVASAALAACQRGYRVGERVFDTPEEAFQHQAFLLEQRLNVVEPLDKPIAKSVTLIIPSAEDIGAYLLATNPKITEQDLDFLSRKQYNIFAILERQLARSNRFERIESVIQDEDGGDIALPPGGYGLWIKNIADAKLPPGRYMRAGAGAWQWLDIRAQGSGREASLKAFYAAVDKFVAENPAE